MNSKIACYDILSPELVKKATNHMFENKVPGKNYIVPFDRIVKNKFSKKMLYADV